MTCLPPQMFYDVGEGAETRAFEITDCCDLYLCNRNIIHFKVIQQYDPLKTLHTHKNAITTI